MTNSPYYDILFATSSPIINEGLETVVIHEDRLRSVGKTTSYDKALNLVTQNNPHLIFLDYSGNNGTSNIDKIPELKLKRLDLNVIVISHRPTPEAAMKCMRAGANGYLLWDDPLEYVVNAINTVRDGNVYLKFDFAKHVVNPTAIMLAQAGIPEIARSLTESEHRVYRLMLNGALGLREIGDRLNIKVGTVKCHATRIYETFKVKDRKELLSLHLKAASTD